ncbi:hypothetical protein N7481_000619 [Penicillium waksmanii]|uniref:uncharacterized protein n=1 Tax=Penicillium waksmanii TaxID=69791 RepID=UPI0025467017|nr:uncharacterized protein N7481_000619 [Penicillium waksmanii]KAJ6000210.1 hypothetical protein N7481_000619 [Penicillium waksmanii]
MQFEEQKQCRRVFEWLRAPNTDIEHGSLLKIRNEYPNTGAWLLEHKSFKDWIHPDYATIPPLLWLKGIPGSGTDYPPKPLISERANSEKKGKTVLASLVVEEIRKLNRKPTVLFFYCKHDNPEFSTFPAIARGLLAQLLEQERHLLPYFDQECCTSKEPILQTPEKIQKLLDIALTHCKSAYIVLDGLDECKREDRKEISMWFRERVENPPHNEPRKLRCLFSSRDDGHGRKDFEDIETVTVSSSDIAKDLETFCQRQADLLRIKFQLTSDRADDIASAVSQRAAG